MNRSTSGNGREAYDREIGTLKIENEMGIKIARATLMGLMVVASLTLFGAIVLV